MSTVRFNDVKSVNEGVGEGLRSAFERVMGHQQWIQGEEVERFEAEWAAFLGVPHAIGCSNGTDALILALQALGVGPGDEVITVSMTFFAGIEAIVAVGARPVLVDVLGDSGLMDPCLIEAAVTRATKAILPVHLYGQAAPIDAISEIASANSLFCVEDAAQAHGVVYGGKALGSWGDIGCFSFYPGKNLGALGDAGAAVTSDPRLKERLRSLRDHGRTGKYEHRELGANRRMDGLQAAFLVEKLGKMKQWDARRRAVCRIYQDGLSDVTGLSLLPSGNPPDSGGSLHLYVVRCEERDRLAARLRERGIETGVHYPVPCHLQPAWLPAWGRPSLPSTEAFARTCLSLPLFGVMTDEAAARVVEEIRKAVR